MIWVLFLLFLCYGILIFSLSVGFRKVPEFSVEKTAPKTKFSVIIPFRNEAKNLPTLIESISKIEYSKEYCEFIFVNDNSEDNSVEIINQLLNSEEINFEIIDNKRSSNSPKKDAITTAIKTANFNWIVTTDADCILPKKWLLTFDSFIQKKQPKMVVAPVTYKTENTFLHRFQLLDFMSMQGTTIGGFGINFPFMCNGANLAYTKEEFENLNGFEGNNHMASGDDVFLFEKFLKQEKNSVEFLKSKDVIVTTFPVNSWKELINQRVRWASKTSNFNSVLVKLIGLLVFLVNASILTSFVGFLFGLNSYKIPFVFFVVKFFTDLLLFLPTVSFFENSKKFMKSYFLSSIVYPFFSVWVVFKSVFFSFEWKGRSFKK